MTAFSHSIKKTFPTFVLVLCGAASTLLYLRFRTLQVPAMPDAAVSLMQTFGMLVALLFLAYLAAAFALKKIIRSKAVSVSISLPVILGFAVLLRLPLLTQTPLLSNDVYRYVWDARVLASGVNPYLHPPEANELSHLRDEEHYPKMGHKHVRTVYPPLLQGVFWLGIKSAQALSINPTHALKTFFVLFDFALILVLIKLLRHLRIDVRWVLLYAWHPLAVIEIASSGHTDIIGVFFLVAALLLLMRQRYLLGAIFLAFAFLVKFVSVLLLPFVFLFAAKQRESKYNWRAALAFGATILVCYLPFIGAGENLFSGLSTYSAKWRFNDAIFSLFFTPLHALIPDGMVTLFMIPQGWDITAEVLLTRRIDLALLLTKTIMAVFFAYFYWRIFQSVKKEHVTSGQINWLRVAFAILVAFFLLSPTLQPWYLLWVLPLLVIVSCHSGSCSPAPLWGAVEANELAGATMPHKGAELQNQNSCRPDEQLLKRTPNTKKVRTLLFRFENLFAQRFAICLWLLSATVFLSYWVLYDYWREGVWQEQAWVKWVEFGLPSLVFFLPAKYWGTAPYTAVHEVS